jgi:citrate synthase
MSEQQASGFKPKKSVALSGVTAGNTALCTVGKTGNDLHYRGYDILDVADACEFEEIAHLLVHGKLPTTAELQAYKQKLKALRGLPANVKAVLDCLGANKNDFELIIGCFTWVSEITGAQESSQKLNRRLENALVTVGINPGIWRMIFKRTLIGDTEFPPLKMAEDQVFIDL